MKIEKGSLVTITYSFKSSEDVLLGTSDYSGPFTFVLGSGDAMEGLEKNLIGAESGESLEFIIPSAEAYGEIDETMIRVLPRTKIDPERKLEVGQQVSDNTGNLLPAGRTFWIREAEHGTITLDANHPMAGMDLHFAVDVLYIGDENEAKTYTEQQSSGYCGGVCSSGEGSCGGSCAS